MSTPMPPRLVAPGEGRTVRLFGVRSDDKVDSAPAKVLEVLSPGGLEAYFEALPPILAHEDGAGPKRYYELAAGYGITILDDWIEELERTHGVKL